MGWVGNNSWTHPAFFSRHLVPQNVGRIIFVSYFPILDWGPNKVNVLLTSPSNQFRDYFIWSRIEKWMPQLWNFSPQTLKTLKQTDQLVFKPWLFSKFGFPKTLDLSMDFPRIFHGGLFLGLSWPGSLGRIFHGGLFLGPNWLSNWLRKLENTLAIFQVSKSRAPWGPNKNMLDGSSMPLMHAW